VPLRVFDVLACGGFLLTDARAGLPELFKPGKDLAVYTSLAELCAKARYYLDHPDERDAVRKHGRIRVLRDYTFDIVLPGIIERALAGTPDYALNRMLDPGKMARALLLAGLAYLKFNQPEQARPRLLDALNLAPESPAHLLAAALLAGRAGQAGAVRACAEKLVALGEPAAAWGRELLEDGHALPAWDRVYRAIFPEARVRPDGTVAGWEARRVAP